MMIDNLLLYYYHSEFKKLNFIIFSLEQNLKE